MTSPTVTDINVPFPEAEGLHLRLSVGACRLRIVPADGVAWVAGTYEDPSTAAPLRISQDGATVRISQDFNIPTTLGGMTKAPTFDLKLGKGKPYRLTVEGGASESEMDLGGLPLHGLAVKFGAGKQEFNFSSPNPEAMDEITVSAGAAGIEMENLANANFERMVLEGGAAAFELDFGGELRRDAAVKITTGMASVEVDVPSATPIRLSAEATLGSVDVGDGFMKKDGAFWNEAALSGKTPAITMTAQVVMGAIQLEQK
ncbi:MAG: hypothetical protein R2873_01305 [Caldilineaceae bacterium]